MALIGEGADEGVCWRSMEMSSDGMRDRRGDLRRRLAAAGVLLRPPTECSEVKREVWRNLRQLHTAFTFTQFTTHDTTCSPTEIVR